MIEYNHIGTNLYAEILLYLKTKQKSKDLYQ